MPSAPQRPDNFTIAYEAEKSVTFKWNIKEKNYWFPVTQFHFKATECGESEKENIIHEKTLPSTAREHTVTNLEKDKSYRFYILAENVADRGEAVKCE